jgi:hypothetical protein
VVTPVYADRGASAGSLSQPAGYSRLVATTIRTERALSVGSLIVTLFINGPAVNPGIRDHATVGLHPDLDQLMSYTVLEREASGAVTRVARGGFE